MEKKEILTKNELKELFKKAKEGNLEAKEEIIIHNLGLINMIINNRFAYVDCEREDLVSYGILGLLKAINSFDIEKSRFYKICKCFYKKRNISFLKERRFK